MRPPRKQLLYSALKLSTLHAAPDGGTKEVHGTCFFVRDGQRLYGVTNRHNFDLAFKSQQYIGYKLHDIRIAGYSNAEHFYETVPTSGLDYMFVPNSAEDIVVMDITSCNMAFVRKRKDGEDPATKIGSPSFLALGSEMLANSKDLESLAAGCAIMMPSYSMLYDASSERPILRGGVISSDPESDYRREHEEPARRILYQAQSAEGASGAPVFAELPDGAGWVLLGVNAGQLLIAGMPSGFSYCFKATCIKECIELLARAGSRHHLNPASLDRIIKEPPSVQP